MNAHPDTMIGRRNLADGCGACGLSTTYCQAVRDMESRACCDGCNH